MKNPARYCHKCLNVFMQNAHYSCRIVIKLDFSRHIFEKRKLKYQVSSKSVQWKPSCFIRRDRQTDRQTDVTKLIVAFSNFAERAWHLWYTTSISLLGETTGRGSWTPKMPTQTLMENRCWRLEATVVWGFSSTQTWVLWKFTIPSRLISKQVLATGLGLRHTLRKDTGSTTTLDNAPWTLYVPSDCSYRNSRNKAKVIPSTAAVLRTLVPGSFPWTLP
jgi:hypothetical protein